MSMTVHDLPVRDAASARTRSVEPALPATQQALLGLLASLKGSFLDDGVEEYLEQIIGWGASPLTANEMRTLVDRLHACLWPLLTDALRDADGRPDSLLRQLAASTARLDAEHRAREFVPTQSHARLLASLVGALLDLVSNDVPDPSPHFDGGGPR
ncbi:DUF6415 family natural product biosynthesis protein [Streptomyces uncialis]|uniref:DUF6415 family natural product biosynthesis protein n=1 Tax=Streptomyces uncialis TaxID=1048205 RepID=UPI00224E21DE|nr:DUF6415 family natural product biosynthesis protein [Streptomyces uncialis]MCX4659124.1 DUF6415 family natural product biosynthesis protein [Streptomyces uncialis]